MGNKQKFCNKVPALFAGFILLGCIFQVHAENIIYVSDQLRVGVRPEPGNHAAPVGVVITGMKLKVLKRENKFIKIQTEKGLTGWIRDIYASKTLPAILQLEVMQKQADKTRAEIKAIEKTVSTLEEANRILNSHIDTLKADRAELQRNQALQIVARSETSWGWRSVWIVALLATGFIAGFMWYRHQSMKRLGGLKI